MARTPDAPAPPPAVQRLVIRYAKRGRLRFSSHRDFQRALERALRRAAVPMAYSAGFTRHPKISYAGAAPTGAASEAEYVEIGVTEPCDPAQVRQRLDESLPPGLDVLAVVDSTELGSDSIVDRLQASHWELSLAGVDREAAEQAARAFLAASEVEVSRMTKNGLRRFDARAPVVSLRVRDIAADSAGTVSGETPCVIIDLVVRHGQPTVRPDDVLTGLRLVANFAPPLPPLAARLAQGPLDEQTGAVHDPLAPADARE
jgi:radical SAM-linked protein